VSFHHVTSGKPSEVFRTGDKRTVPGADAVRKPRSLGGLAGVVVPECRRLGRVSDEYVFHLARALVLFQPRSRRASQHGRRLLPPIDTWIVRPREATDFTGPPAPRSCSIFRVLRTQARGLLFALRGAVRRASTKPSGMVRPPSVARLMNPSKARSERRVQCASRNVAIDGFVTATG
jgi:hypothetical protein